MSVLQIRRSRPPGTRGTLWYPIPYLASRDITHPVYLVETSEIIGGLNEGKLGEKNSRYLLCMCRSEFMSSKQTCGGLVKGILLLHIPLHPTSQSRTVH